MARKRNIAAESPVTGSAASARKTTTPRAKHSVKKTAETAPLEPAAGIPPACPDGLQPEEIARLAYSYWEARGCQGGSAEEDWLLAEQVLVQRHASALKA